MTTFSQSWQQPPIPPQHLLRRRPLPSQPPLLDMNSWEAKQEPPPSVTCGTQPSWWPAMTHHPSQGCPSYTPGTGALTRQPHAECQAQQPYGTTRLRDSTFPLQGMCYATKGKPYTGRAAGPSIKWVEQKVQQPRPSQWADRTAAWWGMVTSDLTMLQTLQAKKEGITQGRAVEKWGRPINHLKQRITRQVVAAPPQSARFTLPPGLWAATYDDMEHEDAPPEERRQVINMEKMKRLLDAATGLSCNALQRLSDTTHAMEQAHLRRAMQEAYNAHTTWVLQQVPKGLGAVHTWIKPPKPIPAATVQLPNGRLTDKPPEVMQHVQTKWLIQWAPHQLTLAHSISQEELSTQRARATELQKELETVLCILRHARRVQGNMWLPPTVEEIDQSAAHQKQTTSPGTDMLTPPDIRDLPDEGKEALAQLIHQAEEAWCWPWQFMPSMVYLKPKPKGGDRALACIYRTR